MVFITHNDILGMQVTITIMTKTGGNKKETNNSRKIDDNDYIVSPQNGKWKFM